MRIAYLLLPMLLLATVAGNAAAQPDCEDDDCDCPGPGCPPGREAPPEDDRRPGPANGRGPPDQRPEPPCRDCWDGALRWISLDLSQDALGFTNLTVAGQPLVASLAIPVEDEVRLQRGQAVLKARADDARLEVHDAPSGLVTARADGTITLQLPPDARLDPLPLGGRISYRGGSEAILRVDEYRVADRSGSTVIHAEGFVSIHLVPAASDEHQPVARERMQRAIREGALGAEITVRRDLAQAMESIDSRATVLAYDNVQVDTHVPDVAVPEEPLRVTVSADLPTGRTFSMTLDPEIVPGVDPLSLESTLQVRYFDVEAGVESEVAIVLADDLEDVLTANTGEAPEYWVVTDPNGIQILFMVPHWSTHVLTVASLQGAVELVTDPPVLIGIAAGIGGAFVAAAAVLWPRRRS